MDSPNNSNPQFNDHDDPIDSDYERYLAQHGPDFFDDIQPGDSEGSDGEIIDETIAEANIAITVNNTPPCRDNVYYETFTILASGHQIPESHVFEFNVGRVNRSTAIRITLPTALSDYVRRFNFHRLVLEVPNQSSSTVHLKYPSNPLENVKIVKGWKKFCSDNDIEFGDRVRFVFQEINRNVCEVTKLM